MRIALIDAPLDLDISRAEIITETEYWQRGTWRTTEFAYLPSLASHIAADPYLAALAAEAEASA